MTLTSTQSSTARGLGGIGQPTDLLRPVSLDGLVVLASSGAEGTETVRGLCHAEGWSVVNATTTDAAAWASAARKTSLVIVTSSDVAFVLETVAAVRRSTTSVIAVLSQLNSFDRRRVLSAGADLVLPVDLDGAELRLHLLAVLRRASGTWEPQVRYLGSGALVVDLWARSCALGDQAVHLSRTEYELLVLLMRHPRQALPIEKIIQRVWQSRAYQGQINAARIAVSRLRTKLTEGGGAGSTFVRSVRGIGYEFVQPVLELGDGASEHPGPELGNLTLSTVVLNIAQALRTLSFEEAAKYSIEAMVKTTGGDAGAIFRSADGQISLIAESGHPEEFLAYMDGGVSLNGRSEVHALDLHQPTQVDEMSRLAKSSKSVQIMMLHGFHSYLYVPLVVDGKHWGGLRLASRSTRPFDPIVTTFCSSVGAMLSLKLPSASMLHRVRFGEERKTAAS
jgi:DNA-binding response OmpR family regulator